MRLLAPGRPGGSGGSRRHRKILSSATFGNTVIRAGEELEGRVANLTGHGAFLDIGVGKHGLLSTIELRKKKLALSEGQKIRIKVFRLREESGLVLIDLRLPDEQKKDVDSARFGDKVIRVGDRIKGRVSNLTQFGAFVDIGVEKHGLVSELHLKKMGITDLVVGQEIYVRVYRLREGSHKEFLIDLDLAGMGKRQKKEENVDSVELGEKTIRVGDKFRGRIIKSINSGKFVEIGLERRGFLPIRDKRLKNGQEVEVEVSRLKINPKKGPLVYLRLKRIIEKTASLEPPNGMPPAEEGIVFNVAHVEEGGFIVEIPEEEKLYLPAGLSLGPNRRVGSDISIIRTGVRDPFDNYEICAEVDFVPVAEKLVETISAKKSFAAFHSSKEITAVQAGREIPGRQVAFFVMARDPIHEDIEYLPKGVLISQDPYKIRFRITAGEFYFRLSMEEFESNWSTWDLIQAMAKKPLLAIPA